MIMLKNYKTKEADRAFITVIIYSLLSLAYFSILDPKFYAKNIFNCAFSFIVPIPYIILVTGFMFLYSRILNEKVRTVVYPIIAISVILPLLYLLADLKIGMCLVNPFGGDRGVYEKYANLYFLILFSIFAVLCGYIFRKLYKKEMSVPFKTEDAGIHNIIFHLPLLIYFAYIEAIFFAKGFALFASYILLLFLFTLLSEKISILLQRVRAFFLWFISNEKLFLITIFFIALAIRYFWGLRLLGLTGDRFILASDDGICYNGFAITISGGGLLPKASVYGMGGFGYWYFLAAIYKIFGVQNFKALILIQTLIGSFVPVLTYFIAKKVFGRGFVPVVAGMMTCLDMTLVFLSVVIGMEAIYIPLVLLAVLITVHLLGTKTFDYKRAFVIGSAFGLAYNARPPELILFPLILVFVIYLFIRKTVSAKRMTSIAVSLLLGFLLFMSIQYATNYIVYKLPPGVQGAATASFRAGVAESHTGENKMLGEMGFSPFEDLEGSVRVMIQNPHTVLWLIAKGFFKRFVILCFYPSFGVFDPMYLVNPGSGYFFRFPVYVQCCGYLAVILGVFAAFRKKENLIGVTVLFAFLMYMASRVAFFCILNSRYRGVLLAAFFIFFAYGLKVFFEKVKNSYQRLS